MGAVLSVPADAGVVADVGGKDAGLAYRPAVVERLPSTRPELGQKPVFHGVPADQLEEACVRQQGIELTIAET